MRPRSLRERISARDVAAAGTGRNGVALVFERLVVKEQRATSSVRVPWNAFGVVNYGTTLAKLQGSLISTGAEVVAVTAIGAAFGSTKLAPELKPNRSP